MTKMRGFLKDCEGASMVEYAFLVTLIAMVVFLAVGAVGRSLEQIYNKANAGLR